MPPLKDCSVSASPVVQYVEDEERNKAGGLPWSLSLVLEVLFTVNFVPPHRFLTYFIIFQTFSLELS
jgi:hypothetical protein